MAKCKMCGINCTEDSMKYQFIDEAGSEYYVCAECDKAITSVTENDDESKSALEYVKNCLASCSDETLSQWLNGIIDSYIAEKNEMEENAKNTTIWISSLRQFFKAGFILIIILGLILCFMVSAINIGLGLIILSLSILIAVLVVGFEIVFLDMAGDLHQIKNILEEIKNKDEE